MAGKQKLSKFSTIKLPYKNSKGTSVGKGCIEEATRYKKITNGKAHK